MRCKSVGPNHHSPRCNSLWVLLQDNSQQRQGQLSLRVKIKKKETEREQSAIAILRLKDLFGVSELFPDRKFFVFSSFMRRAARRLVKVSGVWRLLDRWRWSGCLMGIGGSCHSNEQKIHWRFRGSVGQGRSKIAFLLLVNKQSLCRAAE